MKENWIKICEYDIENEKTNSKIWLEELLETNDIPFKQEVKSYWKGQVRNPSYKEKIIIYVPDEFKSQVEKYIEEYNNPNNMLINDVEELKSNGDTEYEAKRFAKKQKIMIKVYIGILIAMVVSFFIAGIFS